MNAVGSQIFVTLCIYLLVGFQKFVLHSAMGIQTVLRLVQSDLFQRKPWPLCSAVQNRFRLIPGCPSAAVDLLSGTAVGLASSWEIDDCITSDDL